MLAGHLVVLRLVSLIFDSAAAEYRRVREEYQLHLEAQRAAAVDECNGVLLNARGKAAGIDPFTLFKGPGVRAAAYASEELVEFWQRHTRVTWERFERASYMWADADGF